LPLSLELTRIVGQPLFDIARLSTGQQIEWFLTRKAYEKDELVPNKPSGAQYAERKGERTLGGYVKEPDKGLHENIVQFDFRSLYPSIIISKNISPDTFAGNITIETNDDNENDTFNIEDIKYNISPEYGYKFIKEPKGFIPSVLGQVLNERVRVKQMMLKTEDPMEKKVLDVQQQALKRLANTMYGVYGYSRFRWYSIECARSITAWGRDYIKKTMKQAEAYGFKSIYADTDGFYAEYEPKK
jgi:DNA polymerase I